MLDKTRLEKRASRVAKKFGLTDEEVRCVQQAAHALYEEIAADLPPDDKRRGTCERATIIEVVLDAGRLQQRLQNLSYSYSHPHPDSESESGLTPAMERILGLERDPLLILVQGDVYKDLKDLVGPVFPYAQYEVSGSEC